MGGGKTVAAHQTPELGRIVPHPRTLRKAREQVKCMVADKVSPLKIRRYLFRWLSWWAKTSGTWKHEQLMYWYLKFCWEPTCATVAEEVLQHYFIKLRTGLQVQV